LPNCSLRRDADFFDDLGGHSLVVAQLVSRLRSDHGYTSLSLRDVYEARRVGAIADVMARLGRTQTATVTPDRRAVPRSIRILCGCAQALVVPLLVLVNISSWLAPFMVYHYFTGDPGDHVPIAVMYALCTFVVVEVLSLAIGIVGNRLAAGRLRPGRYRLWGLTYFRWWLSDRLADLAPVHLLSGTPLLNGYLRAPGARIGRNVLIDSVKVRAPALLTVGDGVCIGTLVYVDNVRVQDGELIVGRVTLDRDASVDSYALLGENSAMGLGARLSGLSALASGSHVPDGETWQGAPARRVAREDEPLPPRPVVPTATRIARNVFFVCASLAVAVLFLAPVFPSFMLIDWIDVHTWDLYGSSTGPVVAFSAYFLLAIPASALLVVVTVLLASGLRRVSIPRQQPGIFPVYGASYRHKWLTSRILETSLSMLHGLYASVFAPMWLRLMGAHVGRFTEVSTAVGIIPDLLTLGEDSFIADAAVLGDEVQRAGWMTLRTTSVGNRSFVGNGAYLADGANVPDDVLIGVQTCAPDNADMQAGQTWFGSPALSLPAREHIGGFGDHLTYRPSAARRAGRGSIELLRIVLPFAFVIATGYLVVQTVMPIAGDEAWLRLAEMLTIAGIAFAASSFLLVLVLKWTLIGRYQPCAVPMWTPFVWGHCCVDASHAGPQGCRGEASSSSAKVSRRALCVRGLPVPARGDHVGGPLVSALRSVIPRPRGAPRGAWIDVDHVTLFRWVQRFTPPLIDAARPCRHAVGSRWFVDESYVKVAGIWRYVYRAVDEHGQVIHVLVWVCSPDLAPLGRVVLRASAVGPTRVDTPTRLPPPRHHGGPPLLRSRNRRARRTGGHHRPRCSVDERHRRAVARHGSQHRAEREQPDRMRSRTVENKAETDARPQDRPHRKRDHPRTRVHPKPPPRPLRTRSRSAT
jgi:non-ribosomal peptide synthetase-like protein